MPKSFFTCLVSTLFLLSGNHQTAQAEQPSQQQSLEAQNAALREEVAALKRAASEREARQKVAELLILDLKQKLARAEGDANAKVQSAVSEEQKRVSAYMAETDARIASIKDNFALMQRDVAAVSRTSRLAMARAIVKSRSHRLALRTVAALRSELDGTKVAIGPIMLQTGEMKTTSAIDNSQRKPVRRPRVERSPGPAESNAFPFSFSP